MSRLQSIFILLLILLAGLGIRLFLAVQTYTSTFDTGTVALMAMDIAQGTDTPLFFYGQSYFGALEAYVAAALLKIVGHHELVVSAAVIGFSLLWIFATYLLFSACIDRRAGLVAAAMISFCGYQIAWYCVASYGGYPTAFAFGTLVLWLAVTIEQREPVGGERWLLTLGLGLCAGLALWTHLITAPFMLMAGIVLVRTINRETIKAYIVGGVIAAVGFVPLLLMKEVYTAGDTSGFNFEGRHFAAAGYILFTDNIPALLNWSTARWPSWVFRTASVAAKLSLVLGIVLTVCVAWRKLPARAWIPLGTLCLFLLFYFPHEMALVKAPRYIIPAFVLLLGSVFALPLSLVEGRKAWLLGLLPAVFCLSQLGGTLVYSLDKEPRQGRLVAEAEDLAASANGLGCDYVQLVGGYIYGHWGQKYSFFTRGSSRFVSVFDERHQPSAQAADAADRPGYACEAPVRRKLLASFQAVGADVVQSSNLVFRATNAWRAPRESIAGLEPAALFDRTRGTSIEGQCGKDELLIDLGQSRKLSSLWMRSGDELQMGLPEAYRISVSEDQQSWTVAAECASRIAVSYRSGSQLYFKGYHGLQETALKGEGRYLKIGFGRGQGKNAKRWELDELVIFAQSEKLDRPPLNRMIDWLEAGDDRPFVVADRWLSATVIQSAGKSAAFQRYNPKYIPSLTTRALPVDTRLAIAVDEGLAEETRAMIGEAQIVQEASFGPYLCFVCSLKEPFYWNGHFLTR